MLSFRSDNPFTAFIPLLACALTFFIFVIDTFTPLDIAIAVLYGAVILLASYFCSRRSIIALTGLCLLLALVAYGKGHGFDDIDSGFGRFMVSFAAISIIAFLALKGQASTQALLQRKEALREADRRKNEFLAMLAHELRNPLAPISAAAQVLKSNPNDPEVIREVSEILIRQTEHMTDLVNELLDVSRVTRGVITLKKSHIEMQQVVSDAVEQLNPLIAEKRHQLVLDLPAAAVRVRGDYQRLVQIMANLIGNAVKYTPPNGTITVRVGQTEQQVEVDVTDTGIGMPAELIPQVFELFTQAERGPDRAQGGLGIGLALVKSLVELHEGRVTCHSAGIGRGSRFSVVLPGVFPPSASEDKWKRCDHFPATDKQLRILVVDDNASAARMLSLYLQSQGHAVITEHTFHRGLDVARSEIPDVCLLDIGLPEHDGNELARRLRADAGTRHMLLIAITGYDQEKDKDIALAAGFDDYIVKPVDTARLNALLAQAADRDLRGGTLH